MSPSVFATNLNMGDNDVFSLVHALIILLLFATIILSLIITLTVFFEPLTAVLMQKQAVCSMRENGILRLAFSSPLKVFPANKELRWLCERPGNYYPECLKPLKPDKSFSKASGSK